MLISTPGDSERQHQFREVESGLGAPGRWCAEREATHAKSLLDVADSFHFGFSGCGNSSQMLARIRDAAARGDG